jgi:hypothetical protein
LGGEEGRQHTWSFTNYTSREGDIEQGEIPTSREPQLAKNNERQQEKATQRERRGDQNTKL